MDHFIASHIAKLVKNWPAEMRDDFRRYVRRWDKSQKDFPKSSLKTSQEPYWLQIPRWLYQNYRRSSIKEQISPTFLKDVLFGQYCLFLVIRIQDDLYDGHIKCDSLIYVPDYFLWEAEQAFRRHFDVKSSFWKYYYRLLTTTTNSIVKASRLHRERQIDLRPLLKNFAEVASLFKIGLTAICLKSGCRRKLGQLMRAADNLAIAGQIVDDLLDIDEDLRQGHINYAAQAILLEYRAARNGRIGLSEKVQEGLFYSDAFNLILSQIEDHLKTAYSLLRPIQPNAVEKYFQDSFKATALIRRKFHTSRVQIIFGKLADRRLQSSSRY